MTRISSTSKSSSPKEPIARGTAAGKVILLGEHAVVYGRPAIALPVEDVRASAMIYAGRPGTGIVIHALDIGRHYLLDAAPPTDPIAAVVRHLRTLVPAPPLVDLDIVIESAIPIAGGLGSGAAVATAVVRALATAWSYDLDVKTLSALVFESEKLLHGTPSGIDNTVIAYERPIWFVRHHTPEPFHLGAPLHLLIADTGVPSPTRKTVHDVRVAWEHAPETYERLFDEIGALVEAGRRALEAGDMLTLGQLMQHNQMLLERLGVSAPSNERLVAAALEAGALGAKLSGGGRGGNVITLVTPTTRERVREALVEAGAVRILTTSSLPSGGAAS